MMIATGHGLKPFSSHQNQAAGVLTEGLKHRRCRCSQRASAYVEVVPPRVPHIPETSKSASEAKQVSNLQDLQSGTLCSFSGPCAPVCSLNAAALEGRCAPGATVAGLPSAVHAIVCPEMVCSKGCRGSAASRALRLLQDSRVLHGACAPGRA
jgi:hypothetical protein